jgi:hypothetical protein
VDGSGSLGPTRLRKWESMWAASNVFFLLEIDVGKFHFLMIVYIEGDYFILCKM